MFKYMARNFVFVLISYNSKSDKKNWINAFSFARIHFSSNIINMSIVNAKSRCSFFVAIIHFGFRSLQTSMQRADTNVFIFFQKFTQFCHSFLIKFCLFCFVSHEKSTYQINACIFVSHSLKTDYTVSFTIFYIVLFDCVNIKWWKQIFFFPWNENWY